MIDRELFFHNEKAYIILRRIPFHQILNRDGKIVSEIFNGWKEHLGADHVLKNNTHFLYCLTVQDVEFQEITETLNTHL